MSQPTIQEVTHAIARQLGIPLDQAQAILAERLHALDDADDRSHDRAGSPVTQGDDEGGGDVPDDVMARALKLAREQVAADHHATLAAEVAKARATADAERPESKCLTALRALNEHMPKADVRSVLVHLSDDELKACETMMDDLTGAMADHAVERSVHPLTAAPVGGRRAA